MYRKITALFLLAAILLILALNYSSLLRIVGFASLSNIDVAIKEKVDGKILLSYQPYLELGKEQNIYAEFINIGTNPVTAKIEVKIHGYINGTLKPLAHYYDAPALLNPGMRRGYSTVFVPPSVGLYYIQARAPYDSKAVEVWSAFLVYYPPSPVIIFPVVLPAAPAPAAGVPRVSLEYPEKVSVLQGERVLTNIKVKNVGDVNLNNLRLYISTTSEINFTINPKQIARLDLNSSSMFLISIDVPSTTPEGLYPFDFELISDEVKEPGRILVEVSSVGLPEEEEIYQKILNYEFLIAEIERETLSASSKGFDVSIANQSLNSAKNSLEAAKNYFKLKNFEETKKELEKVKEKLEDAAFQLASAALYVYKPFAFYPYLILFIIILIIIGILIYYYRKKKKEKRPRLLRALAESEAGSEK